MELLPLFPLGTVLLPGITFPLRVFEPRYVAMMNRLTRERSPFGVVAIRRGSEVGDLVPELHRVGCAASLESTTRIDDHLVVEARTFRRFRLDAVHEDRAPYLVGAVTWLDPQTPPEVPARLVEQALDAFSAFLASVGARADGLPEDPDLLAASIVDGLGQPLPEQQAVLEAGDAIARLRAVVRLCRREQALAAVLHCRAARVTSSGRLSPN